MAMAVDHGQDTCATFMINGYDITYGLGITLASPFWAIKASSRHKVLSALGQRMGYVPPRDTAKPAILIHAVSLGEMNATRELVKQLQSNRPNLHVVISTTTVTGYDRGRQLYGGKANVSLVRYPLDFSSAINRLLDAIKPSLVVLMEGEIWPNFLRQCEGRKIPVVLVNWPDQRVGVRTIPSDQIHHPRHAGPAVGDLCAGSGVRRALQRTRRARRSIDDHRHDEIRHGSHRQLRRRRRTAGE